MQKIVATLMVFGCCLMGWSAEPPHTHAALSLEAVTAKPGDTVMAAVHLQMDPEWHTYWWNPGEGGLGQATKITWQLPPGITAGEIQWPLPEKLPAEGSTTYIFKDEVTLLVPLKLAPDLKSGSLEITGKVSWLECKATCIPGKTNVTAKLDIGTTTEPSADAAQFAKWQEALPKATNDLQPKGSWDKAAKGDKRAFVVEWSVSGSVDEADFFPGPGDNFDILGPTEKLSAPAGKIRLRKTIQKFDGDWPKAIQGVLVMKTAGKVSAFKATLQMDGKATGSTASGETETLPATATTAQTPQLPVIEAPSLGSMLLSAFLGGLILNIMPCVLPVIALKILGFVNQAQSAPRQIRFFGWMYAAGVLVSFLVLALIVIGIKSAGHKAGWGMQFSNPIFVVAVTTLVTLVALNLFGVFEVTLSGNVMGAAGDLSSRHGASGAFFNGVLATMLATPCTAPFLGVALGFAFGQPPAIILLTFLTVGVGLAAPYVLLSYQPAWLKFLPKPGVWMEKFKMAMGFPMLATALWLASLATVFYGERTWWLGIFLVFVGAAAWVFGDFFQRGSKRRGTALLVVAILLVTGVSWALESGLHWRAPVQEAANDSGQPHHAPEGYPWQPWSAAAVTQARSEGRPIVVDFTASWCQTCNINVKPAFESKKVIKKLEAMNALALVADYTLTPDHLTTELEKFGRSGVPLVLVYSKKADEAPIVLPEPLPYPAPYASVILAALEKIAP